MKVVKLISRVLVVASAIGATGYLMQKTVTYVRRIDSYSITITGNITEQVRESIAQHVQINWPEATQSFAQLCTETQEQFACIKDLDVALMPGKKAHVEISVHEPLYLVNNDQLVTHDGVLLAKNMYQPEAVQSLYQIFIAGVSPKSNLADSGLSSSGLANLNLAGASLALQSSGPAGFGPAKLSASCKQSISQITPDFLDRYIFSWQSDNAAWLYGRNSGEDVAILFHPLSLPAEKILAHCDALKQDLASQKLGKNSKQSQRWVADVRFKDQIVVSASKDKGVLDGTCI
jgi:hypothetical protein